MVNPFHISPACDMEVGCDPARRDTLQYLRVRRGEAADDVVVRVAHELAHTLPIPMASCGAMVASATYAGNAHHESTVPVQAAT
jgi:hypothetical protein